MNTAAPEARALKGTEVDRIFAALIDQGWRPTEIAALSITDAGHVFRPADEATSLVETNAFKAALAKFRAGQQG